MSGIELLDTNASKISSALVRAKRRNGSRTVGVVLTLVIIADESTYEDALHSAAQAAREHPSRILVVIPQPGRGKARLDAEIQIGGLSPGDTIILRMHGPLARHTESVVVPLLLSDNPVVAWWPGKAPECPGEEPLGRLAQRRITDAAAVARTSHVLSQRAAGYTPGDTDLAWTRLTPWRALLAAALDQHVTKVHAASVEGERNNPSVDILAAWLETRLGVPVTRVVSKGPGITAADMTVSAGHIRISRPDGRLAQLDIPGSPTRPVGLRRRERFELLAEELRRLDPDDIYEATISRFAPADDDPAKVSGASARKSAKVTTAAAKKAASSTTSARRSGARRDARRRSDLRESSAATSRAESRTRSSSRTSEPTEKTGSDAAKTSSGPSKKSGTGPAKKSAGRTAKKSTGRTAKKSTGRTAKKSTGRTSKKSAAASASPDRGAAAVAREARKQIAEKTAAKKAARRRTQARKEASRAEATVSAS